jgi:hypothetical protein
MDYFSHQNICSINIKSMLTYKNKNKPIQKIYKEQPIISFF